MKSLAVLVKIYREESKKCGNSNYNVCYCCNIEQFLPLPINYSSQNVLSYKFILIIRVRFPIGRKFICILMFQMTVMIVQRNHRNHLYGWQLRAYVQFIGGYGIMVLTLHTKVTSLFSVYIIYPNIRLSA